MRTPDIEGVATRDGPESCAGTREGAGKHRGTCRRVRTKPDTGTPIEQRIQRAETFFSGINARVAHQGNRAFYSPADDAITLHRSARSSVPPITTAHAGMKPHIGQVTRADAIGNLENDSVIAPMPLRS